MHDYSKPLAQYRAVFSFLIGIVLSLPLAFVRAEDLAQYPLFAGGGDVAAPPLMMLIMGKDHTLYYEAYNDASDLNGDGVLDVGYKPNMKDTDGKSIDYFGYFDSYLCYDYSSDDGRFNPVSKTTTKKCPGHWSGDFLNYITTTRIDALRKVLYGGKRSTDTTALTVLERSYVPQEAHSWGKEYISSTHDGYSIGDYTPLSEPTSSDVRHLIINTTLTGDPAKPLMRVLPNSKYRIWNWIAIEQPVAGSKCVTQSTDCETTTSKITNYTVRVQVCKKDLLDKNCQPYTDTDPTPDVVTYKPDGLLQQYGNDNKILFGLLSGSFKNPYNMKGGVLRKNIQNFANEKSPDLGEVNLKTGIFTSLPGIVNTLNKFRIVDFKAYSYEGGWLTNLPMVSSTTKLFPDWGNPIAEMMYESLRYFSGKTTATSDFLPATTGKETVTIRNPSSTTMELPLATWTDPYKTSSALSCSPAAQLVISDVNPSFDTDQVPGSVFASFSGDITGLNAATEANAIWTAEHGGSSVHFIGEVNGSTEFLNAPTAKTVSGLGSIRGLSPSEPTKQGGYYSAGIARYAFNNDLRTDLADKQDINTFAVALASPLPKIVIPVGTKKVTLVPFAKSVGSTNPSSYPIDPAKDKFQPTNTIVDFFIEEFANTDPDGSDENTSINGGRPSIKFRINYEDVEQGADHDMDAIVLYDLKVNADNTLTVALDSSYAAGGIMQHLGYVISGTTQDGVYLEVRDKDTSVGDDPDYFLDTPDGVWSGGCAVTSPPATCTKSTDTALPLTATRTFTPSSSTAATVLENPLWYAAKYGSEGNDKLAKGEPSPNYFLVTNAGKLQDQLEDAFTRILKLSKETAATAAASSTRIDGETMVYEVAFDPSDWSGEVKALQLIDYGDDTELVWDSADSMPTWTARKIYTWNGTPDDDSDPAGILFNWDALNTAQKTYLSSIEVFNWLRGDKSKESTDDGLTGFRVRTKLLGDIVHSDPLYIGKPQNFNYKYLPITAAGRDTYASFLAANKTRTPMIYVGANDGMLHGFDAATGAEKFAYVPNTLFGKLKDLTSPTYKSLTAHRDFVDGSPNVGDAFVNDAWRSILIGTLGAGGKAVFALDVTNPDAFNAEKIMWEFSDGNLGYMVGQMTSLPVIGRLQNGQWAAVFGNGYDSGTGAWLYIVNLNDGSLIKKIQASTDVSNGLSAVALIRDTNETIAGAYAGDLKGNLWKFDLTGALSAWGVAYSGAPLFEATNDDDLSQPITGPVEVGTHPLGGYLIYFGTGQYMRPNDVLSRTVQSVYGIWDNSTLKKDPSNPLQTVWDAGAVVTGRDALLEQTIDFESKLIDDPNKRIWRIFSQNEMNWGTDRTHPDKRGWFVDLVSPVNGEEGERIATLPQILSDAGQVEFTSWIPVESDDPCVVGGGNSWVFSIDLFTGGAASAKTFDVNDDEKFNEADTVIIRDGVVYTLRVIEDDGDQKLMMVGEDDTESEYIKKDGDRQTSVSGVKVDKIIDVPRILRDDEGDYVNYVPGQKIPKIKGDGNLTGRLNWQQLR